MSILPPVQSEQVTGNCAEANPDLAASICSQMTFVEALSSCAIQTTLYYETNNGAKQW